MYKAKHFKQSTIVKRTQHLQGLLDPLASYLQILIQAKLGREIKKHQAASLKQTNAALELLSFIISVVPQGAAVRASRVGASRSISQRR